MNLEVKTMAYTSVCARMCAYITRKRKERKKTCEFLQSQICNP